MAKVRHPNVFSDVEISFGFPASDTIFVVQFTGQQRALPYAIVGHGRMVLVIAKQEVQNDKPRTRDKRGGGE